MDLGIDPGYAIILGVGALFGVGIIVYGIYDDRRFKRMLKPAIEQAVKDYATEAAPVFVPEFSTVAEIHAYYAKLKETDPKLAGEAMYRAQLKLHSA